MWESFAGAAAARQGILPVAVPPLRAAAAARASQWKSFPVTASTAGGQQLSSVRGGDCTLEAPAPPPQRLLSPSGVLLQVHLEDTLTTWGGFPPRPETCGSVTTPASRSPKQSQGESEGKARRSLHYLSSALPPAWPLRGARARLPYSTPGSRARPHVPSKPPPPGRLPARPTATLRARARARRARRPSALSWRRGAAPVGIGVVPRAVAPPSVAVASSATSAARAAASLVPAVAAFAKAERRGGAA